MRILATCFVYNEVKYLDQWVNWYRSQGCELFVLDNMSNDGTFEWLQENGIPCERFDTNEAFHLHKLQDELMRHVARINPDWVIYCGADLFYITDKPLNEAIEEADTQGFNQIKLPCYNLVNTGERFGTPLQKHFTRGGRYRDLIMIAKYGEGFMVRNDHIGLAEGNPIKLAGAMVNYGGCKPAEEQEEKLIRRQRAWSEGLPPNIGKHFRAGRIRNWIYPVNQTVDLTTTPIWDYIKKTIYEV
jgi:hypothetical protein